MMTLDCQHCGAKLALEGPKVPAEVRCKRCGRRSSTAGAVKARPTSRKPEADPPTAEPRPTRMPPPSYPPPDVRVPPEEVFPQPRPRPGFYDSDSPLPDGKGKAIALIGGVLGVLVAFAAGAWWLLATAQPQTPFVGPTLIAETTVPSNTQSVAGPVAGTTNPASAAGQERGARSTAPAAPATPPPPPSQPSPAPNAPSSTAAPGPGIRASGELLNKKLYVGSHLALTAFEESPAFIDWIPSKQQLGALWDVLLGASTLVEPKTFEELVELCKELANALFVAEMIRSHEWLNKSRPTFELRLTGIPADGVDLEVIIRCKDKAARILVNGGSATKVSPLRVIPGPDGSAQVPLVLRLEQSSAHALKAPTLIHLSIEAKFSRGSQPIGRQELQHTVTAYPASFVEMSYPHGFGFAAMVDEDHPLVKQLIEAINSAPFCRSRGIALGGGPLDLTGVFAVWREFNARGIRYSSIAETSDPDAQEVRTLSEALLSGNANCADGTALWCSILQKLGYDPSMVFIPGHVFVGLGVPLPIWFNENEWVETATEVLPMALEATSMGERDPCSPSFRKLIVERFELSKFESTLNSTDRAEWLAFLAAVESGMKQVQEAYCAAAFGGHSNGHKVQSLREEARTLMPLVDGSFRLEDGRVPTELELRKIRERCLRVIRGSYIRILPIALARKAGVRPIGCDPATLPKDGIGPLKAK